MADSPRTLDQNARLWATLGDIARQLQWPVDGELRWLESWEWKVIITAGLKNHQRIAKGIEGGFVMLGQPTSKMSKRELSELLDLAYAFGAQHNVTFTDPQFA